MEKSSVMIIGYGSQAQAWAALLRLSGRDVVIAFPEDRMRVAQVELGIDRPLKSFELAVSHGFKVVSLEDFKKEWLTKEISFDWVAALLPDHQIGNIYNQYFSKVKGPLHFVIAHGFAVFSGLLSPSQEHVEHQIHLLAPKAIGPKLKTLGEEAFTEGRTHSLKAAVDPESLKSFDLIEFANDLGFHPSNLIEASFETETVGDLISEQGLLCGGVFTLLDWTMAEMKKANIPDELIHEECITELGLIADLLKDLGPAGTLNKISAAAKFGTTQMRAVFEQSNLRAGFSGQMEKVKSGQFTQDFLKAHSISLPIKNGPNPVKEIV